MMREQRPEQLPAPRRVLERTTVANAPQDVPGALDGWVGRGSRLGTKPRDRRARLLQRQGFERLAEDHGAG